jgi:hypothetical protein
VHRTAGTTRRHGQRQARPCAAALSASA